MGRAATVRRLRYPPGMSEGAALPETAARQSRRPCSDLDVNEGKPGGRTVGRIYLHILTAASGSGASMTAKPVDHA
jgi:hypothetical protein